MNSMWKPQSFTNIRRAHRIRPHRLSLNKVPDLSWIHNPKATQFNTFENDTSTLHSSLPSPEFCCRGCSSSMVTSLTVDICSEVCVPTPVPTTPLCCLVFFVVLQPFSSCLARLRIAWLVSIAFCHTCMLQLSISSTWLLQTAKFVLVTYLVIMQR